MPAPTLRLALLHQPGVIRPLRIHTATRRTPDRLMNAPRGLAASGSFSTLAAARKRTARAIVAIPKPSFRVQLCSASCLRTASARPRPPASQVLGGLLGRESVVCAHDEVRVAACMCARRGTSWRMSDARTIRARGDDTPPKSRVTVATCSWRAASSAASRWKRRAFRDAIAKERACRQRYAAARNALVVSATTAARERACRRCDAAARERARSQHKRLRC
jgi:hypothetical protein